MKHLIIAIALLFTACAGHNGSDTRFSMTTMGDSLSWAYEGQKLRQKLSSKYPHLKFKGPYVDDYGYRHAGHGGDTTQELLARLNEVESSDYYWINIGVNDVLANIPHEVICNNILAILSELRTKNANAIIILDTIIPSPSVNQTEQYAVVECVRAINQPNVRILDFYEVAQGLENYHQDYTIDGIHLNAKGYDILIDMIINKIKEN